MLAVLAYRLFGTGGRCAFPHCRHPIARQGERVTCGECRTLLAERT